MIPPYKLLTCKGKMVRQDIPRCGWINVKCQGGCISIHKVGYHCKENEHSIQEHVDVAKKLCEDKEECRIEPGKEYVIHYVRI